jgi:hypothetical protein
MRQIHFTFRAGTCRHVLNRLLILLFLLASGNILFAQTDRGKITQLINENHRQLGMLAHEKGDFRIKSSYFDKTINATIVHVQQTHQGIDVFNALQTIAIKNDQFVSVMGSRVPISSMESEQLLAQNRISPAEAVKNALKHLDLISQSNLDGLPVNGRPLEYNFGKLNLSRVDVKSRLLWQAVNKDEPFMLFWQVEIQPNKQPDYWLVRVNALTGEVTMKDNLTIYCNWGNSQQQADRCEEKSHNHEGHKNSGVNDEWQNGDAGSYKVIPYPAESPIHNGGNPAVVLNPWELSPAGSGATSLKWHNDGAITYESTRGNNVWSQEDIDGNNGTGVMASSQTSGTLKFEYEPDFSQDPRTTGGNQEFNITNLFYWNNIMHDITYLYGFDEASGNFQATNLDRPGLGQDFVFADAQDGIGLNNANFGTPEDGINPRMQMFLWDNGLGTLIDGDVDNGIIAHEYGHGVSNRLTGGPLATTCLSNQEQMGEGWSDYFSLMVTTDWAKATLSDGSIGRGIGTYATNQPTNGLGIRNQQYSTDFSINNHTYKDVKNAGFGSFFSVHAIGEIWCTMLWDMTWALIANDGINPNLFDAEAQGGNSVALKLVMTGMKLQSCSPGFVDGRDAILKADSLLYNGKYSCIIWQAFARRGVGLNAKQGSSYKYRDQVEDFTLPVFNRFLYTADREDVPEGELLNYKVTLNCTCENMQNYSVTSKLPDNIEYVSGGTYDDISRTVNFSGINLNKGNEALFNLTTRVKDNTYSETVTHLNDLVDENDLEVNWSTLGSGGSSWTKLAVPLASGSNSYFANEVDVPAQATLTSKQSFNITGLTYLSFWHLWYTEASYDGGWIEISTDNGVSWKDVPESLFIKNGYNNNLFIDGNNSRKAFSGTGESVVQSIVDLSSYAGSNIKIRFQFSCDLGTTFLGWYLDDISLISNAGVYSVALLNDNIGKPVGQANSRTNIVDGALPVVFGSFSAAKLNEKHTLLKWSTISEQNADKFIIERSIGNGSFTEIGQVAAYGNSNTVRQYTFTDFSPQSGDNQYRIRQLDKDGKSFLSDVRLLSFDMLSSVVEIMPNPASRFLKVVLPGISKPVVLKLINAAGKIAFTATVNQQYTDVNLPQLASGQYTVLLESSEIKHQQALFIRQ